MNTRKVVPLIFVWALVILSACSPAAPTAAPTMPATSLPETVVKEQEPVEISIPEVKIEAADYSYSGPETIQEGWTRVILTNSGQEPHHVQFLRLNDGVTLQQFEEALKQGEGPALAMTKQVGGVGAIHPGGTASAVINLPAGKYVILCFIPSPDDHVAHVAKGMVASLDVQTGENTPAEPSGDFSVHMKDYSFDLPEVLPSGPLTIQVINDGPEPHELNIIRLEDGKNASDVLAFLSGEAGGPPPFTPVGGINGLDTGVTGYAEINFEPGNYAAICNIPSPKAEGHPHFTLGMIQQFTVHAAESFTFPTGKFIKAGTEKYGLAFNPDGSFSVFDGENTFVTGTYHVKGNIMTETSNTGGCPTNVSFTYTYDGANLTFRYIGDPAADADCTGRHADFNDVTYALSN